LVHQTEEKLERLQADEDHDDDDDDDDDNECDNITTFALVLVLGANYFGARRQWKLWTLVRPWSRRVHVLHTINSSSHFFRASAESSDYFKTNSTGQRSLKFLS